jgi:tetratricopeptide (TPR) repeat protein
MAVDPYSPCPCGSGKKLKFCCSDLVADIEKISKLVESDQPQAALKHIEKLMAKEPDRPSLLDMRAMLELSLQEQDAAEQTIEHFLKISPDNPAAHAQAAMLAADRGDTATAVEKLQDALERTDNSMPQRVFEAVGAVGHALLLAGDFIAARAHLVLYAGIAPEGDERALELLLRLNLQGGLPLLLRDDLKLMDPPERFAEVNKAAFEEANRFARRGMSRRAAADFTKLINEANPQPAVVYNLALMHGWLGHVEKFVAGLHQFARLSVPLDDAVEAEALAQLLDPNLHDAKLASVRLVYPINDEDAAIERLASDKRIERYELDPEVLEEDEVTRPRSTHILLDRPVPRTGEALTLDEAPNVLAFLSVYGKRTDRNAQLHVTTDRGENFEQVKSLIAEILGDSIGGEESSEIVAEKTAAEEALSWRWRLPEDTPPARRRELLTERRRQAILRDWASAPRAALDGLSPLDAAKRPELRIPLLACVLIIEQAAANPEEEELFAQLRTELGLPPAERLDPSTVNWDRLPLMRIPRIDLSKAPFDRLMQQFNRAAMTGATVATLALASEIVSRQTPGVDIGPVYRQLIRSEPNPDQALAWIQKAKAWAAEAKHPGGEWAILELEVQIERGDPAGVQHALNDIQAHHANEPGVAEAAYRLLYSTGLLAAREPSAGAMPASRTSLETPTAEPSRLWTPGQESPAPAGNKPAIWTP